MKISKIEKKKRLYLLELDSSDKLYITEDTIVRFMLSKDKEISEEELAEIRKFAQFSYGKNLALYYLSFKRRTKKEVNQYLVEHEIDPNMIPNVLKELEHENWINDQNYAETFFQHNQLSGDKGAFLLQQKLLQKGVDKSILTTLVHNYDFQQIAERVARKLLKKYQDKLPLKALKDKLIQNLMSKGFSYTESQEAVSSLELEKDTVSEEGLIYKELDKQFPKYEKKYQGYTLKQKIIQYLARKGYDYDLIQSALRDYI